VFRGVYQRLYEAPQSQTLCSLCGARKKAVLKIPYLDLTIQRDSIKDKIDERFKGIMDSCSFIMGPAIGHAEQKLSAYTGAPYSLAVGSGTDALILALMAAGVGPGDEVITTSFSFFATAESIALVGAKPVFVDIEPDTYNIDVNLIEAVVTSKTKALMPVSLYGQVANMDEICSLAESKGMAVIEDAAQSFGATYKGKKSGNLSRFGCTSFFPAKPMGCYGDGGAVFCQTEDDYNVLSEIRNHGQSGRYHHTRMGINGRLDSFQCAVLDVKLDRYSWEVEQRQRIGQTYLQELAEVGGLTLPVVREGRETVWGQFTFRAKNREAWTSGLQELGVPTSVHYPKGLHEQPAMKDFHNGQPLPHCEAAGEAVFSVPLYADMPADHVGHVVDSIKTLAKRL